MIVIVGGGFTGLGIAYALKESGFEDFLLLEKNTKILAETSANSMRLLHSGVRELQRLNFLRWKKLSRNKAELLKLFPFFKPIQFLFKSPKYLKLVPNVLLERFGLRKISQNSESLISWEDGFLTNLESARDLFSNAFKGKVILDSEVLELSSNSKSVTVVTSSKVLQANAAILACFGSDLMPSFDKIYAWNIVTKNYIKPTYQAYGELINGRAILFIDRGDELAVGTWYSSNFPDLPLIEKAKQEGLYICKAFTDLSSFELEIGIIPAVQGRQIEEPVVVQKNNIIEVYAAKFTTFLLVGRQIVSLLKPRL